MHTRYIILMASIDFEARGQWNFHRDYHVCLLQYKDHLACLRLMYIVYQKI